MKCFVSNCPKDQQQTTRLLCYHMYNMANKQRDLQKNFTVNPSTPVPDLSLQQSATPQDMYNKGYARSRTCRVKARTVPSLSSFK